MALLKVIWLFIKRLFTRRPKNNKTVMTYKEVMEYVEETPHLRNSYKKSLRKIEEENRAEENKLRKKHLKKKAQKQARKKQRK